MTVIERLLPVLVAYLFGSIPFGLILSRWIGGVDLRTVGSGNIGATNALRSGGKLLGISTLLLDVAKGVGGALSASWLLGRVDSPSVWLEALAILGPVAGHCFPLWLGFKGGKGVATAVGVIAIIAPWVSLVCGLVFLVLVLPTRYVSLGSVGAAVGAAVASFWFNGPGGVSLGIVLIAAMILLRHRENIYRLLRGQEQRLGQRNEKLPGEDG